MTEEGESAIHDNSKNSGTIASTHFCKFKQGLVERLDKKQMIRKIINK